ncbi:MAG: ParB/RepB/Spo0J family partition protein [Patescibacteria group bacterium]|nr:ParB/RepB/Spo0J family partition protein [Patescibacteria group bacterium]
MSNGLGRGLSSLIPKKINKTTDRDDVAAGVASGADKDKILQVDLENITINPMQPRRQFSDHQMDELAESIREYGIIQPLIANVSSDGAYELIAGERRLRAAKIIGLDKVPVIVRDAGKQEKLEVALIENIQRENLNSIELAKAYSKLIDEFNLTQEDVAKRVGKSRPVVANTLRMLNLPGEIQLALISGKITEGHAVYLLGLDTEAKQMNLFRKITRNDLSVSDTNKESKRMGGTKAARIKINYTDKDKEFALREFFSARVEIKRKGKGGQIIIDFFSDEELEEMVEKVRS